MRVVGLVVAAVLLVACSDAPWSTTPWPSPPPVEPEASLREGLLRLLPDSPPMEPGQVGFVRLYTHCWDSMHLDIDGSFWRVMDVIDHDGAPPLRYGNPNDSGEVTIDSRDLDRAVYHSSLGDMTLHFQRLPGAVVVPGCA